MTTRARGSQEGRGVGLPGERDLHVLASQILWSASNFLYGVALLRAASLEVAGAWAILMLAYALVLGTARAFIFGPVLVRLRQKGTSAQSLGRAVLQSGGCGVVLLALAAGPLLASRDAPGWGIALCLAVGMPALLMQEGLRMAAVAQNHTSACLRLDGVWFAVTAVALGSLVLSDMAGPATLTGAWVLGAAASVTFGLAGPERVVCLGQRDASAAPRRTWRTGSLYGAEHLVGVSATLIAWAMLSTNAGLSTSGEARVSQQLLAPAALVAQAVPSALNRRLLSDRDVTASSMLRWLPVPSAAILFFVVALACLPDNWAQLALGHTQVRIVTALLGLALAMEVASGPPSAFLRTRQRIVPLLKARLVTAGLLLAGVGAASGSASGFALAVACTTALGALLTWFAAIKVLRDV